MFNLLRYFTKTPVDIQTEPVVRSDVSDCALPAMSQKGATVDSVVTMVNTEKLGELLEFIDDNVETFSPTHLYTALAQAVQLGKQSVAFTPSVSRILKRLADTKPKDLVRVPSTMLLLRALEVKSNDRVIRKLVDNLVEAFDVDTASTQEITSFLSGFATILSKYEPTKVHLKEKPDDGFFHGAPESTRKLAGDLFLKVAKNNTALVYQWECKSLTSVAWAYQLALGSTPVEEWDNGIRDFMKALARAVIALPSLDVTDTTSCLALARVFSATDVLPVSMQRDLLSRLADLVLQDGYFSHLDAETATYLCTKLHRRVVPNPLIAPVAERFFSDGHLSVGSLMMVTRCLVACGGLNTAITKKLLKRWSFMHASCKRSQNVEMLRILAKSKSARDMKPLLPADLTTSLLRTTGGMTQGECCDIVWAMARMDMYPEDLVSQVGDVLMKNVSAVSTEELCKGVWGFGRARKYGRFMNNMPDLFDRMLDVATGRVYEMNFYQLRECLLGFTFTKHQANWDRLLQNAADVAADMEPQQKELIQGIIKILALQNYC